MTEAVLWDLDGVLADTAPYHFQAWRELFRREGKEISEDDFVRTFGLRNAAILRDILGELPEERVEELARAKEELFRSAISRGMRANPGALPLLERLREAGKKMAIVSSAPRQNVETILDSLGARPYFDTLIAEEDAPRGKPDPQGYLLAAERLGVPPERCVVIEDAPGGVEAAKRASMRCIGLAAGRAPETLREADIVVRSLGESEVYSFLGV
ncbi:MAG: HAD family phosphatase [Dehalococcoidia bacterium]|nr:HAD family phosphatase [Dehalococcoidia bacterium]